MHHEHRVEGQNKPSSRPSRKGFVVGDDRRRCDIGQACPLTRTRNSSAATALSMDLDEVRMIGIAAPENQSQVSR